MGDSHEKHSRFARKVSDLRSKEPNPFAARDFPASKYFQTSIPSGRLDFAVTSCIIFGSRILFCIGLADRSVGEFTRMSDFGRASARAAERQGMDTGEGTSAGTGTKMARVADSAESVEQIHKFEAFGGGFGISKTCDLSLKC